MQVRVNAIYEYQPNGWDRFHPTSNNTLQPGRLVRVINLPSAPPANTMGQCYVADPASGNFLCMVSTGSLQPKPRIHAHIAWRPAILLTEEG